VVYRKGRASGRAAGRAAAATHLTKPTVSRSSTLGRKRDIRGVDQANAEDFSVAERDGGRARGSSA
jgi:hypothetical protein